MSEKAESNKSTEINFRITLDKDNVPERLEWRADDASTPEYQSCKAAMISIWDPASKNTVRFDLWTKEMMLHEMSGLVFQSLLMIGETYLKATGEKKLADDIHKFAETFGVESGIIKRANEENPDDEIRPFNLDL